MSLTTRCPACATTFKVVRDQLRISDGWVRCGRCGDVFDATLDLHDAAVDGHRPAASASAPGAGPVPGSEPGPPPQPQNASAMTARPAEAWHPGGFERPTRHDPASADEAAPSASVARTGFEAGADAMRRIEPTLHFGDGAPPPSERPASDAPDPKPPPADDRADDLGDEDLAPEPDTQSGALSSPVVAAPDPKWWSRQPSLDMPTAPASTSVAAPVPAPARFGGGDIDPVPVPTFSAAEAAAWAPASTTRVQQAVDAQLQKALRRARIQEARLARSRAKKEAGGAEVASADAAVEASEAEGAIESATAPIVHRPAVDERVAEADETFPGFLDGDARPSRWTRRGARAGLAVAAVVALLVLAAQVVWYERDALVARQPSLRPALSALCERAGCTLSALRQIESIRIDGASFLRERNGDGYQLNFTLRNASALPLAMPAIELTLLDTQERAVVRRVLKPSEFGAPAVMPPRLDQSATLSLALGGSEAAGLPRIVGYRVDPFYP